MFCTNYTELEYYSPKSLDDKSSSRIVLCIIPTSMCRQITSYNMRIEYYNQASLHCALIRRININLSSQPHMTQYQHPQFEAHTKSRMSPLGSGSPHYSGSGGSYRPPAVSSSSFCEYFSFGCWSVGVVEPR